LRTAQLSLYLGCARLTQPKYQYISQFSSRTLSVITSVIFILKSLEQTRYAYLISTEIQYLFVTCALRAAQLSLYLGCAHLTQPKYQHISQFSSRMLPVITRVIFIWKSLERTQYAYLISTDIPYLFVACTLRAARLSLYLGCAPHAGQTPAHSTALLHSPCARLQLLNQLYSSGMNTVRPCNFYNNTVLICNLRIARSPTFVVLGMRASHAAQISVYFAVLLAHAFSYYISYIHLVISRTNTVRLFNFY